jgi:hypothetical protein
MSRNNEIVGGEISVLIYITANNVCVKTMFVQTYIKYKQIIDGGSGYEWMEVSASCFKNKRLRLSQDRTSVGLGQVPTN